MQEPEGKIDRPARRRPHKGTERRVRPFARLLGIGLFLGLAVTAPARAQLGLPAGGLPTRTVGSTLGTLGTRALDGAGSLANTARSSLETTLADLAKARIDRLARFAEDTPGVDLDEDGNPARAGEVLLLDPEPRSLEIARTRGFVLLEKGDLDGLGFDFARLRTPAGLALPDALALLRRALPGAEITADQIHFRARSAFPAAVGGTLAAAAPALPRGGRVGIIDGGVAPSNRLAAQKGFAKGAPARDEHAGAIASLLAGAGTARIYVADVYGTDPAGGDALSIARALAWMQAQGVPVVSISLVGPGNALLARAVAAAQAKGMLVVAAVGNDGAAAPPAYPASYAHVVAVTGVDGRGRVLIEAGRASHLDYAAPGADLSARVPGKGRVDLRGTSYAAPLAASRLAARRATGLNARQALAAVDEEALARGDGMGRGLVCNICRSGL